MHPSVNNCTSEKNSSLPIPSENWPQFLPNALHKRKHHNLHPILPNNPNCSKQKSPINPNIPNIINTTAKSILHHGSQYSITGICPESASQSPTRQKRTPPDHNKTAHVKVHSTILSPAQEARLNFSRTLMKFRRSGLNQAQPRKKPS